MICAVIHNIRRMIPRLEHLPQRECRAGRTDDNQVDLLRAQFVLDMVDHPTTNCSELLEVFGAADDVCIRSFRLDADPRQCFSFDSFNEGVRQSIFVDGCGKFYG